MRKRAVQLLAVANAGLLPKANAKHSSGSARITVSRLHSFRNRAIVRNGGHYFRPEKFVQDGPKGRRLRRSSKGRAIA